MVDQTFVLPDSSVWIEFFGGRAGRETDILRSLISTSGATLLIGDLILYEVSRGARSAAEAHAIEDAFARLKPVTLSDPDAARRGAARYRHLRGLGITVRKSVDVLIASWCLDHDATLLHRDRDFAAFTEVFGLKTL